MLSQPELSALLEALEQSACNPEIASVLAKSLLRVLQLSSEKTVASFKTLNAVSRVLKVACILAQECKRSGNMSPAIENSFLEGVPPHDHQRLDSSETSQSWTECMETCMELFAEFFSVADDARSLVLHDPTCIDCLFELFWEEGLRHHVLKYIFDLMKVRFGIVIKLSSVFFTINLLRRRPVFCFFPSFRLHHYRKKIEKQCCTYVQNI